MCVNVKFNFSTSNLQTCLFQTDGLETVTAEISHPINRLSSPGKEVSIYGKMAPNNETRYQWRFMPVTDNRFFTVIWDSENRKFFF